MPRVPSWGGVKEGYQSGRRRIRRVAGGQPSGPGWNGGVAEGLILSRADTGVPTMAGMDGAGRSPGLK